MKPPFASYESGSEEGTRHTRLRDIPFRMLVPNILTLLAICSGLTAIRFAIEGRIELSLGAIILAAILDGIDGRVARFLKSATPFGAQMDSLADFVNFGVAPAMVLYFTMLHELKSFGWVAALVFAICACLRLARFNVQPKEADQPAFTRDFFVGVPAPAGAMVGLLPLYLLQLGLEKTILVDALAALFIIGIGLLMVSNLPAYSGKSLGKRVPRQIAMPMILAVVVFVAILLSYPWFTLSLVAVIYLVALPWSQSYYNRLETAHLQNQAALAQKENAAKPAATRSRRKPAGNPQSGRKKPNQSR